MFFFIFICMHGEDDLFLFSFLFGQNPGFMNMECFTVLPDVLFILACNKDDSSISKFW